MKRILLLLTPLLFCAVTLGQNGANLRLNLEKNKTYRLRSSNEQTILQTVNGNQQTIESSTGNTISLKMVDATQAFVVAEVRIDTLTTKTNSMGKITSFSSTMEGDVKSEESSVVVSYFMNKMSRNPLYAKIDFTGKSTEIVNLKMVAGMVLKDTSLITLSDPVGAALKTQVSGMVSEDGIKAIIDAFTNYLPGKMVNTGEKWSVTTTSKAGGMSLDITTTYKLDGISGNNASITSESTIKATENAVPMESGGAKITYDNMKGMSKSNLTIDIRSGLVLEMTSKTHLAGNLGVTVPGMSMDIPMDISSNSKISLIQ
jgi:hypothetical protein